MTNRIIRLVPILFILLFMSGVCTVTSYAQKVKIPTASEVGAANLPKHIAPVQAPFTMPSFSKPTFPALTIKLDCRGEAAGLTTSVIQSAIDEVNKKGGGTVIISKGVWHTGRIILKSNVNLHIAEGAELHFSGKVKDYQPAVFTRNEGVELNSLGALIYAYGEKNIAVTGKGKLIGPALNSELRKKVTTLSVDKIDASVPVADRVYNGSNGELIFLPTFIGPVKCENVYVEGISLERTPFWNVVPVYCDKVIIRGITVHSVGIPRGDGIDVESSRNVLIEYCTLSCGDDCFTIKAGRGDDALRVNIPTENVVIRHCLALEGHGGVTCGSETGSTINNVYAHDCVFLKAQHGIRFKTRRPRGGGGNNLYYERIRIVNSSKAIYWDMLGSATYVGGMASRLPAREVNKLTPTYKNVFVKDIVVEKSGKFVELTGIPESPVMNVMIENADVMNTTKIMSLHDVDGFVLKNATVHSTDPLVDVLDGRNIRFENVTFDVPGNKVKTQIKGPLSRNIHY